MKVDARCASGENSTMKTGVYAIVNLMNGNAYIGSASRSFARRFREHRSQLLAGKHHSRHLQAAWNKYGQDAFLFAPVFTTHPDDAVTAEQMHLDGWKPAYNILPNAGSNRGHRLNDEQKARKSASSKAMWLRPETRERNKAAIKEVQNRPEIKANKTAVLKALWGDQDHRDRRIASLRASGSKPEFRAKMRVINGQRFNDPEFAAKLSAGQKCAWADPDKRAARISSLRDAANTPESKERKSLAAKQRWADPEYHARVSAAICGPRLAVRARSKITPELKMEIQRALAAGESQRSIARRVGIDQGSISQINRGVHWTDDAS